MKKAILVAIIGALTLGVNAGDWGKAPVYDKTPIEECVDLGGEISAGYMSDYTFYGVRYARDSVWTDVNYSFDSIIPITVGAWYLNGISGAPGYDELDLYISGDLGTYAGFDVSVGYVHYLYPEASFVGSYGEVGVDISRSLGFVDLVFESNYALHGRSGNSGGWYHGAGIEKSIPVSSNMSLDLAAGVGYSDGYYAPGTANAGFVTPRTSGWNHYYMTASLPIELNCRTTLTPYVGYNGSPDTWVTDGINGGLGAQSDIFHGGVSLSVSF